MAMIVFFNRTLPTLILRACRLVYEEAYPVLLPTLQRLAEDPLRFVVDPTAFEVLFCYSLLEMCFRRAIRIYRGTAVKADEGLDVIEQVFPPGGRLLLRFP
ncbi:hypothetical protein K491DRAFT_326731 [Lophiostoma macrostomum CBS 122681]|uniref:Uncharacterized protein n=1 Tax=Lophiostoma macrostomum CBS 122681 TaxID=1314788 RepID=A0A6A6TBQ7_9PLEO|nr:hypothetical protein K491DRAFT_326731 [Lophiostoma macrostomum CBS 122681]